MLVVADSSPFIGLVKIDCVGILPRLYGSVIIPPAVERELRDGRRPEIVRDFMAARASFVVGSACATSVETIPDLDEGEIAAISLAQELSADILLIDDNLCRRDAMSRNIQTLRTTALLFDAAKVGAS